MNKKTQSAEIISMLNDGFIEEIEVKGSSLILKIEIEYLAQVFNKNHEYIYLKLSGVEKFSFYPWEEDVEITEVDKIVDCDIEIVDGVPTDDGIEINVRGDGDYTGGSIQVICDKLHAFNQDMEPLSYLDLDDACQSYGSIEDED